MRDRLLFVLVLLMSALLALLFVTRRAPSPPEIDVPADASPEDREPGAGADAGQGGENAAERGAAGLSDAGAPDAEAPAQKAYVEPPAYVRKNPDSATACAPSMLLVDGIYCPFVAHRCAKRAPSQGRAGSETEEICLSFQSDVLCEGRLQHRIFCIDEFEYPNLEGAAPVSLVSYEEAKRACALEGKRLCTAEEWEFACEGTQMWPYPYGLERDGQACNIDRKVDLSQASRLRNPHTVSDALSSMDLRVASGSSPKCISPFGVRDMTGNVDEWVENTSAKEGKETGITKGGSFFPGRALCRFSNASPGVPPHSFGAGFRCCADAKGSGHSMKALSAGKRAPRLKAMDKP